MGLSSGSRVGEVGATAGILASSIELELHFDVLNELPHRVSRTAATQLDPILVNALPHRIRQACPDRSLDLHPYTRGVHLVMSLKETRIAYNHGE
jgi:hypothetical protein